MTNQTGFWSGMSGTVKVRFCIGLIYLLVVGAVISQAPIAGFVLLMLPILWTVFVIWIGSESGVNFGPYRQRRETAFSYVLRFLWQTSAMMRATLSIVGVVLVLGGLGWISTEKLRAEVAEPTLTESVTTATQSATDAATGKVKGWVSTAKGWFTSEE